MGQQLSQLTNTGSGLAKAEPITADLPVDRETAGINNAFAGLDTLLCNPAPDDDNTSHSSTETYYYWTAGRYQYWGQGPGVKKPDRKASNDEGQVADPTSEASSSSQPKTFVTRQLPIPAHSQEILNVNSSCLDWNDWIEIMERIDFDKSILVTGIMDGVESIRKLRTVPAEDSFAELMSTWNEGDESEAPRSVSRYLREQGRRYRSEKDDVREQTRNEMVAQRVYDSTRVLKKLVVIDPKFVNCYHTMNITHNTYDANSPKESLETLPPEIIQAAWLLSKNPALRFTSYRV